MIGDKRQCVGDDGGQGKQVCEVFNPPRLTGKDHRRCQTG